MSWIDDIKDFSPYNEEEVKDKEIILEAIDKFDNILERENQLIHITGSGFVLNRNRDKLLMVDHKIFKSWSLPGGHADGEGDLIKLAIKEVKEETGLENLKLLSNKIISLDILPVYGHLRAGKYVSAHLHASLVYLFEADEEEDLIIKEDENTGVEWIALDQVSTYSNEAHMIKVYEKIITKIRGQFI